MRWGGGVAARQNDKGEIEAKRPGAKRLWGNGLGRNVLLPSKGQTGHRKYMVIKVTGIMRFTIVLH